MIARKNKIAAAVKSTKASVSRDMDLDLDFDFDVEETKPVKATKASKKASKQNKAGSIKRKPKVEALDMDLDFDVESDELDLEFDEPAAPVRKPRIQRKPKEDNLSTVISAVTERLNAGVSVEAIVKAVNSATDKADRKPRQPKEDAKTEPKTTGGRGRRKDPKKMPQFIAVTRDFGFRVDRDTLAEHKEKFKASMERAKRDDLTIKVGQFNKIITDGTISMIVTGLVKSKGEWTFRGFDANGKRASIAVAVVM